MLQLPSETSSTSRRYKAINGAAAAKITSIGERRTLRFARDDGRRMITAEPPATFAFADGNRPALDLLTLTLCLVKLDFIDLSRCDNTRRAQLQLRRWTKRRKSKMESTIHAIPLSPRTAAFVRVAIFCRIGKMNWRRNPHIGTGLLTLPSCCISVE